MSECYVIIPIEIDEVDIDSTSVADEGQHWEPQGYTEGDTVVIKEAIIAPVYYGAEEEYYRMVYYCESTHTATRYPPDHLVGDPTGGERWSIVGPMNNRKMFDQSSLTETTDSDEIEIEVSPFYKIFNRIALFCDCASIDIVVEDSVDGVVFSESINCTDLSEITDCYSWLYSVPSRRHVFVVEDLPIYPYSSTTTITFTDTGETVSVGSVVFGMKNYLGKLQYGYSVSLEDYAVPAEDLTFTNEIKTDSGTFRLKVPANSMYRIKQLLKENHATWLVWVGASWRPETIIYGKYESLTMTAQGLNHDYCSVKILEAG